MRPGNSVLLIPTNCTHVPVLHYLDMLRRTLLLPGQYPLSPFLNGLSPRRRFHFDTHHFVQRLEREGLNRAQAEGIMSAMADVIDESIRNMTSNMVTKADQEKVRPLFP